MTTARTVNKTTVVKATFGVVIIMSLVHFQSLLYVEKSISSLDKTEEKVEILFANQTTKMDIGADTDKNKNNSTTDGNIRHASNTTTTSSSTIPKFLLHDSKYIEILDESDFVELRHCSFDDDSFNWTNFLKW